MIYRHYFPDLLVWFVATSLLAITAWRHRKNRTALVLSLIVLAWLFFGAATSSIRIAKMFPRPIYLTGRAGFLVLAVCSVCGAIFDLLTSRMHRKFNPDRRRVLNVARAAAFAAPAVVLGAGYLKREDLRLVEADIPVRNLPKDLNGLRIVQLSDLHLSPLVSESLIARAVDMANETRAHIALVTGDLISSEGDPLDECIRQIARLRSDSGVWGCLGNHEQYASCEHEATVKCGRVGIKMLRRESAQLRFGSATLNFVGVDYQRRHDPYLVGADKLLVPGATNILLSHNPDVFPTAADLGYDLTIGGHTHGGQINVEIVNHDVNIARFYTPYIYGLYRRGNQVAWVTRGIGTIGVPARLGAPPEVALLRLCAI